MVFATWCDRNAPTRFRHAGDRTAVRGRSAPVAIEVAIALAVSWKPLVKSKTSAVTTTTTTISGNVHEVRLNVDPAPVRSPSRRRGRPTSSWPGDRGSMIFQR